jgi:hypothetical protein
METNTEIFDSQFKKFEDSIHMANSRKSLFQALEMEKVIDTVTEDDSALVYSVQEVKDLIDEYFKIRSNNKIDPVLVNEALIKIPSDYGIRATVQKIGSEVFGAENNQY